MNEEKRKRFLKKERGFIPRSSGFIRVALGYPNKYSVGMSSLGFQWVWYLFNSRADTMCERFFYDSGDVTIESGRKVILFDIIAFSISYEMDYRRVVEMIERTGLPPLAKDRDERMPLFVAGGGFASINPEPLAPFFDVIVVGDGEGVIDDFMDLYHKIGKKSRAEFLKAIYGRRGVYVPSKTGPVYRGDELIGFEGKYVEQNISFSHPVPFTPAVSPYTHLRDMELIEVERGCRFRCRFCTVGFVNRPFREYSPDKVLDRVWHKRVGLIGASLADYSEFDSLIERLSKEVEHIGVSSIRADRISMGTLKRLASTGVQSITIAPEVATKKLMKVIGKGITKEMVFTFVDKSARAGIRKIKMYFLMGVPGEDEGDVEEMGRLISEVGRQFVGEVRASVNVLIPKPFTEFEREPLISKKDYLERKKILKRMVKGIRVDIMSYNEAFIQTLYSRGGRRTMFDRDINKEFYVYHIGNTSNLPWEFIKKIPLSRGN